MSASTYTWEASRLHAVTPWFGKRRNLDPSAPGVESEVLTVDPASLYGRLLLTFQDLFDRKTGAQATAEILATLILADEAPVTAWVQMCGLICMAAESWESASSLLLVDVLIVLAKTPHALPYHPTYGANSKAIKPGDTDFAELPGLAETMNLQGPRAYLGRLQDVTSQARQAAQDRWRNINFFAVNLTLQFLSGSLPKCINFAGYGLYQLVQALEYPMIRDLVRDHHQITVSFVELGYPANLWLPAATQWILSAGRELVQWLSENEKKVPPGPLWRSAGGGEEVSVDRFVFWQQKLLELTDYSTLLGEELTAECAQAAGVLDGLLQENSGQ